MISIDIPGYKKIEIEHLVLDYNGTLAIDGKLIEGVKPLLEQLSENLTIHVLTADTFGSSARELSGINCSLKILEATAQDQQKETVVQQLGKQKVVAIGNGFNDALMLKSSGLGIVLMQAEGAATKTLMNADIVCQNIIDALHLLIYPKRLVASLRN